MIKKLLITSLASALLFSCKKEKVFDGPDFYQDGFESYQKKEDLLLDNDVYWSFTQQTMEGNSILVDTTKKHSGSKALKFNAKKSDGKIVSKCSISKQNMAFWQGEAVRVSAWYYLEGTQKLDWLFLLDLEEQTAIGAGPGMRLALVDNKLRVEHKYNEDDILQNQSQELEFPRDQWVQLVWEVKLTQKKKGHVKLWQNGQLIIDKEGTRTLPKDILYFQQGTKGMYSAIEIGLTANSKDNDAVLWVDEIKFEKAN